MNGTSARLSMHIGWLFFGTLPFLITVTSYIDVALVTWPGWNGYVTGIQLSLVELVAIGLWLTSSSLRVKPRTEIRRLDPIRWLAAFYFLAVLMSLVNAPAVLAGLFYVVQLIRVYIVYRIVTAASEDKRVFHSIIAGLCFALLVEGTLVIWQKLAGGLLQPSGTFVHQNLLGLSAHYVTIPAFALALRTRGSRVLWIAVGAGAAVALLTASRATLGISAVSLFLTFLLVPLEDGQRKMRMAVLLMVGAAMLVPVGLMSLERRFEYQAPIEDYDERAAFELAAQLILSRNPFGVGANNFNVVANASGAYNEAGVAPLEASRSTLVHNAYWLTAAETGYIGIFSYILLVLGVIWIVWNMQKQLVGSPDKAYMIGCAVAYIAVAAHSFFEWIVFTDTPQYLWAITLGLAVAAARRAGVETMIRKEGKVSLT